MKKSHVANKTSPSSGALIASASAGCLVGGAVVGAALVALFSVWLRSVIMWASVSSPSAVVLHSVQSPNESVIAYVIADNCGATCGCKTRVDIATADDYYSEVFRSYEACDLTVKWKNASILEVRDPDYVGSEPEDIDIRSLGNE